MSYRPVEWSPLAGSDPVPGDPDRVEALGRHYQRVAVAISDAAGKLRRIAEHEEMRSEAVAAFGERAGEVAEEISRVHERYEGVGRALSGYAPELREAQSESVAALVAARRAEDDVVTAGRLADAAQARIFAAAVGADATADQGDHRRALVAAEVARDELAAARRRLLWAVECRDAAAQRAMRLVQEVKDSGGLNGSWWESWGAKIVHVIVKVVDAVAVVAGVLTLLVGWIPVIGQALAAILGTVALLASVVSLVFTIALALAGDGEWSQVAFSALGVLSFGVGRAAIGALRVSARGVRGASRLVAGRLAAQSVAARVASGLPGSGNSMVALRSMLGTANPLGRRLARRAVRQSLQQGLFPSASSIARSWRAMPGEFTDNLRTLRHADWGHALRQARRGGMPHLMRILGEHSAAADLQDINKIHPAVRASDEVAPHLRQLRIQQRAFYGTAVYNMYDIFRNTMEFAPPPSTAEQLHLPNAHQPVGPGTRP